MSYEVMVDIYKTFKIEDNIVGNVSIEGRSGSSGIWESPNNAIKIIVFDKSEDENIHLPVLLVYKGNESVFYKEFILACIEVGCEISKVVEREDGEYEQIFRKKKNVKMIKLLNDESASRKIMINNFINRITVMKDEGITYSNDFVKGWKALINELGTYTDKMLFDNFFYSNIEDNEDGINIDNNKRDEKNA
jgi:hypothetical protein